MEWLLFTTNQERNERDQVDDRRFMESAAAAAQSSQTEDDRIHPKVGAVVVVDGAIVGQAHRGELGEGAHAEFSLLEGPLRDVSLVGGTLFTTLEPCTSRNHPKVPCASRIIERKLGRVVIGMLDPNPRITGEGFMQLQSAGVSVETFSDKGSVDRILEMNREFVRVYRGDAVVYPSRTLAFKPPESRPLDEWYKLINETYWNRNYSQPASSVLAHMIEDIAALSVLASERPKPKVDPQAFMAKTVAWWLALCGRVGVRSVEELLWTKFPSLCPYCRKNPHEEDPCLEAKTPDMPGPDWYALRSAGAEASRPRTPSEWQLMFRDIYPISQNELYASTFARLLEEVGELAEAVRVFPASAGYFVSEAADVFAWMMRVQNLMEYKAKVPKKERGQPLLQALTMQYPGYCTYCKNHICACPPISPFTIGRIGHDVAMIQGVEPSFFLPAEELLREFSGETDAP